MGGVDRSDRMVRTYSTSRRSKKWWYRLFCYCVDTALANSYILYNQSPNHRQLTYFQYVEQVTLGLIGTTSKVKRVQPSSEKNKKAKRSHPLPVSEGHWPIRQTSDSDAATALPTPRKKVELSMLVNFVMFICVLRNALSCTIRERENKIYCVDSLYYH